MRTISIVLIGLFVLTLVSFAQVQKPDDIKPGTVRKNSIGMEFVWVPPGQFIMGSELFGDDEKPEHRVTISQGFWMGKFEVTQGQWQSVIGTNPSHFKDCGANCPVESVSWDDAQGFIKKLNAKNDGFVYSLPTEAEWEYAARAGTTGNYAGNLYNMAWYRENSGLKTHPVGTKQANAFGLYDMHGNVWELCTDWYGDYSAGSAIDPKGPASGESRVLRGGSWGDQFIDTRSASRLSGTPSDRGYILGLRVAARIKSL